MTTPTTREGSTVAAAATAHQPAGETGNDATDMATSVTGPAPEGYALLASLSRALRDRHGSIAALIVDAELGRRLRRKNRESALLNRDRGVDDPEFVEAAQRLRRAGLSYRRIAGALVEQHGNRDLKDPQHALTQRVWDVLNPEKRAARRANRQPREWPSTSRQA